MTLMMKLANKDFLKRAIINMLSIFKGRKEK